MKKNLLISIVSCFSLISCSKTDTNPNAAVNGASKNTDAALNLVSPVPAPTPVTTCTSYFIGNDQGHYDAAFSYVTCSGERVINRKLGDVAAEVCVNTNYPVTVTGHGKATKGGICGSVTSTLDAKDQLLSNVRDNRCFTLTNIESSMGFAEYRVSYTDCSGVYHNVPIPMGKSIQDCMQSRTIQTNFASTLTPCK